MTDECPEDGLTCAECPSYCLAVYDTGCTEDCTEDCMADHKGEE